MAGSPAVDVAALSFVVVGVAARSTATAAAVASIVVAGSTAIVVVGVAAWPAATLRAVSAVSRVTTAVVASS